MTQHRHASRRANRFIHFNLDLASRAGHHRGAHTAGHNDSTPHIGRQDQALNHFALHQMRVNNFVDVALIDIGVPGLVGVDHRHGSASASVKTAGLVDSNSARPSQTSSFDTRLAVVVTSLGALPGAAGFLAGALIQAEKNVVPVIAHNGEL